MRPLGRHQAGSSRPVLRLQELLKKLKAKGANLLILSLGLDTVTPTGKLMLTLLGGMAEFERGIMLERQREGITNAKAEEKYKGRKPTVYAKADKAKKFQAEGLGAAEIAKRLGIGRASVYRIFEDIVS